ncbi:MAG TPA: sugar phosphate isomerase/epimerase family protein, partial [Cyclobacteriaceae bacterium]|nr:sugar phosphate isomerase/epimerase family protein [Cyclobacteriaceae bacterium]
MDLSFGTLLRIAILLLPLFGQAQPQLGVATSINHDSILNKAGYKFMVEAVPQILSPVSVSDSAFQFKLNQLKKLALPVYALNIFIPGDLKLVGPNVNEQAILSYTRKVFERCKPAGIRLIVWGSGGARSIPEGYSKEKARQEFVQMANKIAAQAEQYGIILALENLNQQETNFINTVAEALQIVKDVNHTNFKLCADIYHMLRENEPASVLLTTKGYLIHCDIAEKGNRTPPGTAGDDFTTYLQALKQIGYSGKIVL